MRVLEQGKSPARARALALCCALSISAAGCGRFGFEPGPAQALNSADAGQAAPMLPRDWQLDASSDAPEGLLNDASVPSALEDAGGLGVTDGAAVMVPPDAVMASPEDAGLGGLPAGTWQELALPYASGAAASAVLSDGLHYLGGSYDYYAGTRYRHHYVYDAATNTWSATPADVPDGDTWGARAHVFEDRLYLVGGFPGGRRLRVYDPNNDTWSSLQAAPVDFQWGFASGIIGGALYAFGGEPGPATSAPGYKYDFAAGSWTSVAPIPENRGRGPLSSAVVGSRLYVLNGNRDNGSTLLQIYDSTTNTWSTGASLPGHLFEAAASSVLGSQIYFLGGAADQDLADSSPTSPAVLSTAVNIYDTVTHSWSTGPAMDAPRMWATAQVYKGKLHVLGGLSAASLELPHHSVLTP